MMRVTVMMRYLQTLSIDMANGFSTFLVRRLDLKGGVNYSVLPQLFPDLFLDNARRRISDYMHSSVDPCAVNAPDMNMMRVNDSVYRYNMLFYFLNVNRLGRFFKKYIPDLF